MKPPRIVVVGSSNTDMIIKLDRIPRPGETLLGGEFFIAGGGKGANQAVGAARAGGRVAFVARLGQDDFGDQAIAGFAKEGIDVEHIYRDPKVSTGVALIFVDQHGENSIGVAPGANGRLSPADLKKAREIFSGASVMVVQLEIPLQTVQTAALLAAKSGARVILNPAPARELPDGYCATCRSLHQMKPKPSCSPASASIATPPPQRPHPFFAAGACRLSFSLLGLAVRWSRAMGPRTRAWLQGKGGGYHRRRVCLQWRSGGRTGRTATTDRCSAICQCRSCHLGDAPGRAALRSLPPGNTTAD